MPTKPKFHRSVEARVADPSIMYHTRDVEYVD